MEIPKTSTLQKVIIISTAVLLLYVSFDNDHDIHLAKILGIVFASLFLTYGVGQLQIPAPKFATFENIKKTLYFFVIVVVGAIFSIAGLQVYTSFKAKAEYNQVLTRELNKTKEQKAQEAKAIQDTVYELMAEEEQKKKAESEFQKLSKKSGVPIELLRRKQQ